MIIDKNTDISDIPTEANKLFIINLYINTEIIIKEKIERPIILIDLTSILIPSNMRRLTGLKSCRFYFYNMKGGLEDGTNKI